MEQPENVARTVIETLALPIAPEAVRLAVVGDPSADRSGRAAFALGQINFAQAFAGRAFERRADDAFIETLVDSRYEGLVRALSERPMSGVTLASRLGWAA